MITTFGEIMLRISPTNKGERITQSLNFRVEPGGSEANVAIALANLGYKTQFLTKLPDNELSRKIILFLNQFSVNTSHIKFGGDRLGIYWTENGIGPRPSFVIYDRVKSSFSKIEFSDIDWESALKNTKWFHTSGISPAVSKSVYNTLETLTKIISEKLQIPISIDLNYRAKLWDWVGKDKKEIKSTMKNLCSYSTLICGNETDFQNCLNYTAKKSDENEYYTEIAEKCFSDFSSVKYVAISLRKSLSASVNKWSGFLFVRNDEKFLYKGVEFNIDNIVDRVGAGDSFTAGILFALQNLDEYSYQDIINFAVSLSALKHSIFGDASRFGKKDVISVMKNMGSGRIIR